MYEVVVQAFQMTSPGQTVKGEPSEPDAFAKPGFTLKNGYFKTKGWITKLGTTYKN